MKKKAALTVSIAGIATLAAGYAGASWYAGQQIEKQINVSMAELTATSPMLKISDVTIRRGIFSTSHEMTFGIDQTCFATGTGDSEATAKALEELEKFKIRVHQDIAHGPLTFTDGIKPGLASYSGSIMMNTKTNEEIKKLLGGQALMAWKGHIAFDGNFDIQMSSPKVEHKENGEHLVWDGVSGNGTGNMHDKSYKIDLLAPKLLLTMRDKDSSGTGQAVMENMRMTFSGYESASKFPLGSGTMSVGKLLITEPKKNATVSMSNLVYSVDMKEANNFISMTAGYKLGDFTVDGADKLRFGPAVLEIGFEHLHAPTVSAFYKNMNSFMCVKPGDDAKMMQAMNQMKDMGITLLKNNPVFALKKFKVDSSFGNIEMNGKIALAGFEPGMVDNMQTAMQALPQVVTLDFNGTATENLFMAIAKQAATKAARQQLSLGPNDELPAEHVNAVETSAEMNARGQLQMAVAQNFIKQENDRLSLSFSFAKGKASLNGQPMNLPFLPSEGNGVPALDAAHGSTN